MADIGLDNYDHFFELYTDQNRLNGFVSKHGIANFLNVPYAKVPVRFRPAHPISLHDLPSKVDVDQYGPKCPQKADAMQSVMSHVFERVSAFTSADEVNCLHLNIYTPPNVLAESIATRLPVFVWIHGGGFNIGDNTTQFDGNHLVKKSLETGKPIVVVSINYRLNVFGFTHSKELEEESNKLKESHVRNLGLDDQRLALQWINSHIRHFGGDGSRITLAGESAGAISVLCHVKAGLNLFQQVLIESPPAVHLRTVAEAQASFDKLVAAIDIPGDVTSTEKLLGLRSATADNMIEVFDGSLSFPIEDPDWFGDHEVGQDTSSLWSEFPAWCKRIMMGNTRDEAALFLALADDSQAPAMAVGITKAIVPDAIVPTYVQDQNCTKQDLVAWSTEVAFTNPLIQLATKITQRGTSAFVYRIGCIDPFPGPLQGFAWHSFGIPFTFYLPPVRVYPELAAVQDNMNTALLDYFYGLDPWERYNDASRMIQWNGKETKLIETTMNKTVAMPTRSIFSMVWIWNSLYHVYQSLSNWLLRLVSRTISVQKARLARN